ncbi:hypothetical protein [Phocaeicola sp.]
MVIVFALNHLGLGMNSVAVHRRGRLNLPDNILMVYLWMHSGGFNPPLRWTAYLKQLIHNHPDRLYSTPKSL